MSKRPGKGWIVAKLRKTAVMEPISDHGLQLIDLGVDFPKGGKPEDPEKNRGTRRKTGESGGKPGNLEKNPPSTGESNYNNSTHMSSKFWESTEGDQPKWLVGWLIGWLIGRPTSYNPVRPGLTSELRGERQCAKPTVSARRNWQFWKKRILS